MLLKKLNYQNYQIYPLCLFSLFFLHVSSFFHFFLCHCFFSPCLTVFPLFSLFSFICHLLSSLCHFYPRFVLALLLSLLSSLCPPCLTVYPRFITLSPVSLFILVYPLSLLSSVCLIYLAQYRYDKIRYVQFYTSLMFHLPLDCRSSNY